MPAHILTPPSQDTLDEFFQWVDWIRIQLGPSFSPPTARSRTRACVPSRAFRRSASMCERTTPPPASQFVRARPLSAVVRGDDRGPPERRGLPSARRGRRNHHNGPVVGPPPHGPYLAVQGLPHRGKAYPNNFEGRQEPPGQHIERFHRT